MRTVSMLCFVCLAACGSSGEPGAASGQSAKSGAPSGSARSSATATAAATATATATATASAAGSGSASASAGAVDQSKPENVVKAIFDAANNDDTSALAGLCDDTVSKDGDVKMICGFTKGDKKWESGKADMVTGKIVGTKVEGDTAKVDFTFGKDGSKKETVELKKVGEKWFLAKM